MARKPRVPKEKREPAHKMDGDGLELTGGDGAEGAESEWSKQKAAGQGAVFSKLLRHLECTAVVPVVHWEEGIESGRGDGTGRLKCASKCVCKGSRT